MKVLNKIYIIKMECVMTALLPVKVQTRVCVTIEFSSRGVQAMFLAYIGGLFLILSENENESTSHKKF